MAELECLMVETKSQPDLIEPKFLKHDIFRPRQWQVGHGRAIELGQRSVIMGILNATPDSFSDGGEIPNIDAALFKATKMISEGAEILDVGGESTRPGAEPVNAALEQDRVLGIIEALSKNTDALISIDTYRGDTAKIAINLGAHIVNDISGLTGDNGLVDVCAQMHTGLCIMHTSRRDDLRDDLIDDQVYFLTKAITKARRAGLLDNRLVIDPGFGFGKTAEDNFELLNRFAELHKFKLPILTGTSRKRFTACHLPKDHPMSHRDHVTSATSVIARMAGSAIFRVHDIASNKMALDMVDSVISGWK